MSKQYAWDCEVVKVRFGWVLRYKEPFGGNQFKYHEFFVFDPTHVQIEP